MTDTVSIASGSTASPNPAPAPLPIDLSAAIVATNEAASAAVSAAEAAAADREQTGADRVAAGNSAGEALTQAGLAATAKADAQTARDTAQKWATQTDAEVVTGQGYGAKKYALDAAGHAGEAAGQVGLAAAQVTLATTAKTDAVAAKGAAESARDLTLGYRDTTQSLKDSASALALQAQGYMNSAAASAASASAVSGLSNLSAAARAIVTATDVSAVCIYDTTRDSDGGAWREKVAHTSWMQETLSTGTRGATAKFPAKALIVARCPNNYSGTVTAYDLTDPTCPMWMVIPMSLGINAAWNGGAINAMDARNGVLALGGSWDMPVIWFVDDRMGKYHQSPLGSAMFSNTIAQRAVVGALTSSLPTLRSGAMSVAMTVLPLTPANPLRCGLPNPTIAVGTATGCSIIRADGVVCNSANTSACGSVSFDAQGNLWGRWTGVHVANPAAYLMPLWNLSALTSFTAAQVNCGTLTKVAAVPGGAAVGGTTGSARIMLDAANPANSLIFNRTTAYATGYMPGALGAIKFAMAESSANLAALADASTVSDRSAAGNNATVHGSLTRTVVATGADIAAIGGFSAANYLEVPYSAGVSIGSSDFAVMGWVNMSAYNTDVCSIGDGSATWGLYIRPFSTGQTNVGAMGALSLVPLAVPLNTWAHICACRINGVGHLIVNGVRAPAPALAGAITLSSPSLRIGNSGNCSGLNTVFAGQIAQFRMTIGAAPTPDQIAAIYAAELPMFAAGAKCLLAGSASVQGLAYDPDSDQLAIATSVGTSLFRGLTRVGYTSVAGVNDAAKLSSDNHKAVAFAGGDLVIGSAAQVYGSLAAADGLRVTAKARKPAPVYDPTRALWRGVTTDATPTVIAAVPIPEGRAARFQARVAAVQYGGVATERAVYVVSGVASRDLGGNANVTSVTTTMSEVTATLDCVASANTTAQTLEIKATGKAATRLAWVAAIDWDDSGLMGAA